jgi:hypothetical protein
LWLAAVNAATLPGAIGSHGVTGDAPKAIAQKAPKSKKQDNPPKSQHTLTVRQAGVALSFVFYVTEL